MDWFDATVIWLAKAVGVMFWGLLAIWLAWQFTIHLNNLLGCWTRYVIWYRYRSRCTCEASDPVKWLRQGGGIKPSWRWRLTDRGKGLF